MRSCRVAAILSPKRSAPPHACQELFGSLAPDRRESEDAPTLHRALGVTHTCVVRVYARVCVTVIVGFWFLERSI